MVEVLFVSKPLVTPIRDGSLCLVRDIAQNLSQVEPRVMTWRGAAPPLAEVATAPIYSRRGRYAASLVNNIRAAAYLGLERSAALWHFVFAPNPRSSQMGSLLRRWRNKPILQTIASPPRQFDQPERLLFGDVVVAQSQWTREHFEKAYLASGAAPVPRIEVVLPPAPTVAEPSAAELEALRHELGVDAHVPLIVYPGDLEVETAVAALKHAVGPVLSAHPLAVFVFAYRDKSQRAQPIAESLASQLPWERVRFLRETPHIHALLKASALVVFPVDDLYGKVDLPIVLLEAMRLRTPVLVWDQGPLRDLRGAERVPPGQKDALVQAILGLVEDPGRRERCIAAQARALEDFHAPSAVARAYEALYQGLLGGG